MAGPLDARLADLRRAKLSWPFVAFALVAGACRADMDFLAAKTFGHSMARAVAAVYPEETVALREAGERLGMAYNGCNRLVSEVLPLAVAFCGVPPRMLDEPSLDALGEAIDATPMLSRSMRRSRRAHLFGLRRLLY